MLETPADLKAENSRLKKRLKVITREKANLQMAVDLINQVTNVVGLTDVVKYIVQILVGAIGGSNIAIYYEVEGQWQYVDALGEKCQLDEIDDDLVRESLERKTFLKQKEKEQSRLTIPGFPGTYETWVYPLRIHNTVFGAVKLQGMALENAHYRYNIDPFIQYASLVLYHEVSSVQRLTTAYQKVRTAAEALEKSKEQFELAMKFANEGLYDWDLQTNEIYFSPVWKGMLGYRDDEIANDFSEWERLTRPEDAASSWKMLNEVLEGKRDRFEKEFQMRHKDGHWVDILSRANVIFDENGKGVRVVGTHMDISRIKEMENALRESELKYRSIMEASKDPTYICSPDYHVQYMNPAMVEWIGGDRTGEICHEAIHGLTQRCPWCTFKLLLEGESVSKEIVTPRDKRRYLTSNAPIVHVDGSISKLSMYHDVTDLMEIEARLQRAQKMESIGNLAGGIAHDFNNLLSPIIGMSELLLEDLDPSSLEYRNAKEILTAGKRGSDLVKQILAFSRQSEHEMQNIPVQPILKEVFGLCRSTIPSDIRMVQDIRSDCGKVMADPSQLHQIAMNLVTNAYHAVEMNRGRISVSLQEVFLEGSELSSRQLDPGPYAMLTVGDTGTGIDPDIIDKIFEPYFTTKEQGKGTGLGLATIYGIIKEYRGDIKVYSEVGKGSTINVYLPVIRTVEKADGDPPLDQPFPTGDEAILIVDDEPAVAGLQKQMLNRLGYQVTVKTDSREALELFRGDPDVFDLIVTDMTMPQMTGEMLAREVMALRPDIPVIICTGFSERIDPDRAEAMGIKAFLMKPMRMKEFSKTVRQVLDERL